MKITITINGISTIVEGTPEEISEYLKISNLGRDNWSSAKPKVLEAPWILGPQIICGDPIMYIGKTHDRPKMSE